MRAGSNRRVRVRQQRRNHLHGPQRASAALVERPGPREPAERRAGEEFIRFLFRNISAIRAADIHDREARVA
jgi:hypothetical protein